MAEINVVERGALLRTGKSALQSRANLPPCLMPLSETKKPREHFSSSHVLLANAIDEEPIFTSRATMKTTTARPRPSFICGVRKRISQRRCALGLFTAAPVCRVRVTKLSVSFLTGPSEVLPVSSTRTGIAALPLVGSNLRSYFRFRALTGDLATPLTC
jgi:hypothetical protein